MDTKRWWKSKTIRLAVLEIIAGAATLLTELPPEASWTAILSGILFIVLRVITKQAVGR